MTFDPYAADRPHYKCHHARMRWTEGADARWICSVTNRDTQMTTDSQERLERAAPPRAPRRKKP